MSALNSFTLALFETIFGPVHNSIATDFHWALKPPAEGALLINVLLNGGEDEVAVWVFDPNDRSGKTLRRTIQTEAHAEQMARDIQSRVTAARRFCA